jgi:hypothetical protein
MLGRRATHSNNCTSHKIWSGTVWIWLESMGPGCVFSGKGAKVLALGSCFPSNEQYAYSLLFLFCGIIELP